MPAGNNYSSHSVIYGFYIYQSQFSCNCSLLFLHNSLDLLLSLAFPFRSQEGPGLLNSLDGAIEYRYCTKYLTNNPTLEKIKIMSTQVQLHSVPLSIISVPHAHYPLFFHGIVKLLTGEWEQEIQSPLSLAQQSKNQNNGSLSKGLDEFTSGGNPISRSGSTSSASSAWLNSSSNATSSDENDDGPVAEILTPMRRMSVSQASPVKKNTHRRGSSVRSIEYENSSRRTSHLTDEDILEITIAQKLASLKEFVNISVTPAECSIICPTELVPFLFGSALDMLAAAQEDSEQQGLDQPSVLQEQYLAIQVDGDGAESGLQLLDLTAPLSAAGIPIFFIPTYFSDYVLVPWLARGNVLQVLERSGFVFSNAANCYINSNDATRGSDSNGEPRSPIIAALNDQVVRKFRFNHIKPHIDTSCKLLLSGTRTDTDGNKSSLYLKLIQILVQPPTHFSVTCAGASEVSFLMPKETLTTWFPVDESTGSSTKDFEEDPAPMPLLLGSATDYMVPVASFDLAQLPENSTGIVAGVASHLLTRNRQLQMRYLSTAHTGIVMAFVEDLDFVCNALNHLGL